MKKLLNILGTGILVLLVILLIALVGTRPFGIKPYAVLSGSMEPNYHVGALIYVKAIDKSDIDIGTPITFLTEANTPPATHRVVEITENGEFITKGDANETCDGTPVPYERVIGSPVWSIPYLGYLAMGIQKTAGKLVIICLAGVALLLQYLSKIVGE